MARKKYAKKSKIDNTILNTTDICSASLMSRFKAFITDTFMLTMPLMYIVFYFVMGSREEFAQDKIMGWIYIFLPHFILIFSLWYFKQQTPGLKAYELSLVDAHTGNKASVVSLINRYIQTFISIVLILPLFYPYLNKQKKTFQDVVSGTCIKSTPNPTKEDTEIKK
jgi:uncharacterized RDD family membrane protein YckC